MALSVTSSIESVNGGGYHRLYLRKALSSDSQYPFRSGQSVQIELAETVCERQALVVLPAPLELDREASQIEVSVSETIQTDLEEVTHE